MSRLRLIAVLLALVTIVAYLPVVNHGFSIFDDNDYITNNNVVQDGLTWAGIEWAFTTSHAANWHPVTWLSHMTDCDLEAVSALRQALQVAPDNVTVLMSLARVLAADDNPKVRNGRTAFAMAQRAITLSGDSLQPALLDVLAMAFAEVGDFKSAQEAARDSLNLAQSNNLTNDAPVIRQHLQLYQNHQPFRLSNSKAPSAKTE